MIVIMEPSATEGQIAEVVERLSAAGARVQRLDGERVTLAASGTDQGTTTADLAGVAALLPDPGGIPMVTGPAPGTNGGGSPARVGVGGSAPGTGIGGPADPQGRSERGFRVGEVWIGAPEPFIVAGPCSVEKPDEMHRIAEGVAAAGGAALRAGAYKPRSSPYSFQGLGEVGLAIARSAADAHGLLLVSEVLDAIQIPVATRYVDILQVGARNMYNTTLLRELGRARRPVLLKRGLAATVDEWLSAAEYIVSAGNPRVILCERGIRTFETSTRNTLDLNAVPVVRSRTRLPILVDPSHGTGQREFVPAMARAAIACGADGLLIEAHTQPERATSDAAQTIDLEMLRQVAGEARLLREVIGRGA
jgi:3-deoxy-7-phosphoheptulonate synthase